MLGRVKSRIFYGWFMVAAGFGVQLITGGLMNQAYGSYLVLLQNDFGWSKTSLSAAFSLARFESGLLGPLEGWLIDRFGPRTVMRLGLSIFGLGFMLFSQVDSLVMFYVAFVIMALGQSLGGFLPLTVAVVNWFRRRRATALAVMQSGFAVGGLCVPIVVVCLETFGWRWTAFGTGLLTFLLAMPLSQVVRHRPEDYGMTVDGVAEDTREPSATGAEKEEEQIDFTPGEAVRTPAFWLISLGHGSALLVVSAVMVHLVAHLNENLGYSLGAASLVVFLLTLMQLIGQLTGGVLGDRLNKRLICAACMAMHMTGLLLVAYATMLPMVIAAVVLHGLGWGIRGPLMQAIRADYFGRASFGMIMGLSALIVMFGNTFGPVIAGAMADRSGNYETGFTVLACIAGLASVFFLLAKKPPPPHRLRLAGDSVAELDRAEAALAADAQPVSRRS